MWGSEIFYHETLRGVITGLLDALNGIKIARRYEDADGIREKIVTVPIRFATEDVMIAKLKEASKKREIRTTMPRMSLSLDSINTAQGESRRTDPELVHYRQVDPVLAKTMDNGTPVSLSCTLSIAFNKINEGFNILEYILARFRPNINVPVYETALGIKRDLDVRLSEIVSNYSVEIVPGKNRVMLHRIGLATSTWVYPPIYDQGIIKHIDIDWIDYDERDLVYFTNTWDVDPRESEEDDPHDQILRHVENQDEEDETSTIMITKEMNK